MQTHQFRGGLKMQIGVFIAKGIHSGLCLEHYGINSIKEGQMNSCHDEGRWCHVEGRGQSVRPENGGR